MTNWQWAITQTAFLSAKVTEPTLSWLYAFSGTASLSDTLTVNVQAPAFC